MVKQEDIIIFNDFNEKDYDNSIKRATAYAILSVPYTWDRMGYGSDIDGIRKRITNIIKGKVAEYIFEFYCKSKGVNISTKDTQTEFWRYDKKDFVIDNTKFDLKNNFFFKSNGIVEDEILEFPALIPVKQYSDSVGYIFSFMSTKDFFNLELSDDVLYEISQINNGCSGQQINNRPIYFTTERQYFLDMFDKYGKQKVIDIYDRPELIICGVKYPNDVTKEYFSYLPKDTTLQYKSGRIKTRTNNYYTKIKNLNPFKF